MSSMTFSKPLLHFKFDHLCMTVAKKLSKIWTKTIPFRLNRKSNFSGKSGDNVRVTKLILLKTL